MKYLSYIIGILGWGLLVAYAGWGVTIAVTLVVLSERIADVSEEKN